MDLLVLNRQQVEVQADRLQRECLLSKPDCYTLGIRRIPLHHQCRCNFLHPGMTRLSHSHFQAQLSLEPVTCLVSHSGQWRSIADESDFVSWVCEHSWLLNRVHKHCILLHQLVTSATRVYFWYRNYFMFVSFQCFLCVVKSSISPARMSEESSIASG